MVRIREEKIVVGHRKEMGWESSDRSISHPLPLLMLRVTSVHKTSLRIERVK